MSLCEPGLQVGQSALGELQRVQEAAERAEHRTDQEAGAGASWGPAGREGAAEHPRAVTARGYPASYQMHGKKRN